MLLGAFGAHALRGALDATQLSVWQTAVQYHFWHVLALFGSGLLVAQRPSRFAIVAAVAFGCGIVLFCGSLYALALGAPRMVGVATPFGGLAFIAGWVCLGVHALQQ